MPRPRLLDLFCGAGGIARGYHDAGFEVIGVDIEYQSHYPYEFVKGDAIAMLSGYVTYGSPWPNAPWFDAIHVSPPCQDHIRGGSHPHHGTGWMVAACRHYLLQQPLRPWVIENVPGAPMRADYELCGCMFSLHLDGMQLARTRWFETSWNGFEHRSPCDHGGRPAISVTGHGTTSYAREKLGRNPTIAEYRALMGGIDWMNRDELSQAIPPQYGEYIGRALLEHLAVTA